MVRGHLSPCFLPLDARSQDIQNGGGVIGPRDNVFPGPAVALDRPESANFTLVREKLQKLWFACAELLQLRWSHNILSSKVDMLKTDCHRVSSHSGVHVGLSDTAGGSINIDASIRHT